MTERFQVLGLVEYQRVRHCPWALLHIERPLSSRKLGCSRAIQDCNGAAASGSNEAGRGLAARLCGEGTRGGVGLFLASEQEEDLVGPAQRGQAERDAVDERLEPGLRRQDSPALAERRRVREERRDVPVRPDAEQYEVERGVAELALVVCGGLLLAQLAPDAMDGVRAVLEAVEQRELRQPVVRALILGRHAALVAPPDGRPAPVGGPLGSFFVRPHRRLAAGQEDVAALARPARQALADDGSELLLVLDDDELDVPHCSPAASSRDLSIAA